MTRLRSYRHACVRHSQSPPLSLGIHVDVHCTAGAAAERVRGSVEVFGRPDRQVRQAVCSPALLVQSLAALDSTALLRQHRHAQTLCPSIVAMYTSAGALCRASIARRCGTQVS